MTKPSEIQFRLKEAATQHGVQVVFAVASGHHADGIALPEQRIEIRFAYLRSLEDYLRVQEQDETIAPVETADILLTGWDIRKWLRQIGEVSPHVFAWVHSPAVYTAEYELDTRLKALAESRLAMRPLMHHFTELGAKLYHVYLGPHAGQAELTVQRYLEMAHTILCARWLQERETYPPRDFSVLLSQLEGNPHHQPLQEMHQRILSGENPAVDTPSQAVSEFLFKTLQTCLYGAVNLKGGRKQMGELDALFYELVQQKGR
ncbi:MAG: DNA polymerase beta superfamily protein [Bacteroidota bacterium]